MLFIYTGHAYCVLKSLVGEHSAHQESKNAKIRKGIGRAPAKKTHTQRANNNFGEFELSNNLTCFTLQSFIACSIEFVGIE